MNNIRNVRICYTCRALVRAICGVGVLTFSMYIVSLSCKTQTALGLITVILLEQILVFDYLHYLLPALLYVALNKVVC